MKFSVEEHQKLLARMRHMEQTRAPWWTNWREISDFFLPRRYPWLLTDKETRSAAVRNTRLLDSTSTTALRTLATGMMNGITSPARPWFRLRLAGFAAEQESYEARMWLDEAAKRMLLVMAESNFYNALGILYLEWAGFGTASMGIYEDHKNVIHCYNFAVGEFFIENDYAGRVGSFSRRFSRSVGQVVEEFGLENCSPAVQADFKAGGARLYNQVQIWHLIEPRPDNDTLVRPSAAYRELYWEYGKEPGLLLRAAPLDDWPCPCPRWETYGTDTYGSSPCMDALPDVRQLQQLIKERGKGLAKMVSPPMLINAKLASRPKSLQADGFTYVPGHELNEGARPVYQINIPFQELNMDIAATQARIRQVLFNDLFRMISELDTVRSATEIDARREEKLVLLGPVLERFESEGLSPCIERIFKICLRGGVFPPAPEELLETEINVQYVGVLSDAQRAVGTVAIERYLQLIGNMAAMFPDALEVPNPEEMLREYADAIGLGTKLQKSREQVAEAREAREQQQSMQQMAEAGQALVGGAQQLSETDLGGGQNALQAMIGGGM
jgi:hypothetical protein